MNPTVMMAARIALLLAGIACFAYSMNSGSDIARWVAIGCVAAALLLRVVGRLVGRS
jgi:hypothetical protein